MLIQIDSRENERIKTATEYYQSQGLTVEVCELEVGDYLFDGKVCFEFKTIPDMVSSIQSGRVFTQAINMTENYDYCFVLIQGDEHNRAKALAMSRNYQEVSYFGYLGALASLNRYCTVIESYTPFINEAYYRMLITAKKIIQNKLIVKKFPRKHKNPIWNFLAYNIYGLSASKAKRIIDTYHIENLNDLKQLNLDDLTMVEGIGEKTATNILTAIGEL